MNVERMEKAIELLEAHADNGVRFDLDGWLRKQSAQENWWGTVGCAVGLFMLDDWFKKEGLEGQLNVWGETFPVYKEHYVGWAAVNEFFGIREGQAHRLFDIQYYNQNQQKGDAGAKAVANRMREMVENYKLETAAALCWFGHYHLSHRYFCMPWNNGYRRCSRHS